MIQQRKAPRSSLPPVICSQDMRGIYTLHQSYPYYCPVTECVITAPEGFQWDGHSVPLVARLIIRPHELSPAAALFHDLPYRFAGALPYHMVEPYRTFSREESDLSYMAIMRSEGVEKWKRDAAFKAVRSCFGRRAWGSLPAEITHPKAHRMAA